MNEKVIKLEKKFLNDINSIALGFIENFQLEYSGTSDLALLRWLDFRMRYVEPKPRKIIYSNSFEKNINENNKKGLKILENLIIRGDDVNPYQSKGLTSNDTLSEKKQIRTDLLWADWGIIHFHLTDKKIPANQYFSNRSDWLLFCIVDDYFIRFIDIRHHNEKNLFSLIELLEITIRSYPKYMEKFELNRDVEQQQKISDEDIHDLRKSGINFVPVIDNVAYQNSGQGITSASTPIIVTDKLLRIQNKLSKDIAKFVYNPDGDCKKVVSEKGVIEPGFSLCITKKRMTIYEEKSETPFFFPCEKNNMTSCFLSELNELISPEWAVKSVFKNNWGK